MHMHTDFYAKTRVNIHIYAELHVKKRINMHNRRIWPDIASYSQMWTDMARYGRVYRHTMEKDRLAYAY